MGMATKLLTSSSVHKVVANLSIKCYNNVPVSYIEIRTIPYTLCIRGFF